MISKFMHGAASLHQLQSLGGRWFGVRVSLCVITLQTPDPFGSWTSNGVGGCDLCLVSGAILCWRWVVILSSE